TGKACETGREFIHRVLASGVSGDKGVERSGIDVHQGRVGNGISNADRGAVYCAAGRGYGMQDTSEVSHNHVPGVGVVDGRREFTGGAQIHWPGARRLGWSSGKYSGELMEV